MRPLPAALGLVVLAIVWTAPAILTLHGFTVHMSLHVAAVAVAAPLLAIGFQPALHSIRPLGFLLAAPIGASVLELVVIWSWHAPALHHLARASGTAFAVEQLSFLMSGMLVWAAALGGKAAQDTGRNALAGAVALLMTSMHMTLLGALIGLSTRPLYAHHGGPALFGLSPLEDQHVGAIVMLAVGGASYLAGGVALMARVLAPGARMERMP